MLRIGLLNQTYEFAGRLTSWEILALMVMATVSIVACQAQPNQIFIEVDGRRQALTTPATTVREALAEANITLDPLDKVNPDLYAQLELGLVIVVTRVTEKIDVEREIIPFERQTIVNEALASGETRLAQLGANGEAELSIRVIYEDGLEVGRTEVSRRVVIEPAPEILVTGPPHEIPSLPIEGTIAYLSNGNAWLMRDRSGSRRALTTQGDLDNRVFNLSPDGRRLLYTTKLTDELELPLNEMWLASTTIVGETPLTVGVRGVLHAEWSPIITSALVAYSTAERTASSPGWRANNDLWLFDPFASGSKPVQLLAPNTQGLYPWWGVNFTWSPDGKRLAYARADQIGVIHIKETDFLPEQGGSRGVISHTLTPLLDFAPLQTFSEWVWVPGLSWSPDGQFIAATIHGPPLASEPVEESQIFDLWIISTDGTVSAKVAERVGMWANPVWGKLGIAFGQALNPLQSVNSRYNIQLIDRDGSNNRRLFPFNEELGVQVTELAWSPTGKELLLIYNGNLYLISANGSPPKQLTTDDQVSRPQWVGGTSVLTNSTAITITATPTDTGIIIQPTTTQTSSASPDSEENEGNDRP